MQQWIKSCIESLKQWCMELSDVEKVNMLCESTPPSFTEHSIYKTNVIKIDELWVSQRIFTPFLKGKKTTISDYKIQGT